MSKKENVDFVSGRSWIMRILTEAKFKFDELEDGRLGVQIRFTETLSKYIYVDADDETCSLRLCDFWWYDVDSSDIEKMAKVLSVINAVNYNNRTKTVYFVDEDGVMHVSTLLVIPYTDGVENPFSFLTAQLLEIVLAEDRFRERLGEQKVADFKL